MSDDTICAHCGLPLHPADYGLYNAHPESRCIDLLRAELAEARQDAERYRKWRHEFREGSCGLWNVLCEAQSDAEHDAAIDAARGGES